MNLFDQLTDEALRNVPGHAPLRAVVEKELLHHDILREMNAAGLLSSLTFIDGTCLRACYGSARLSEDLDFTGGADFTRETLAALAKPWCEPAKPSTPSPAGSPIPSRSPPAWTPGNSPS
jgi:hypothetical protein